MDRLLQRLRSAFERRLAGNCDNEDCGAILCESCLDDNECPVCGIKRRMPFENAQTDNDETNEDETTNNEGTK